MPTVAAQIKQAHERRTAALERGGITFIEDLHVTVLRNKMFELVRTQRDQLDGIIWRWVTNGVR